MNRHPSLKILHVLRAPVGGLFRHVLDLAQGQAARGHRIGIVAAAGGGPQSDASFAAVTDALALGVTRVAMARQPGLGDLAAIRSVARSIGATQPDVVHGHGAKGGAYVRMAAAMGAIRVYTPHGGSLHYGRHSARGIVYGTAERLLMARTDLLLFESAYARDAYQTAIGHPRCVVRVVPNGVSAAEFDPVTAGPQATDLVAIGELRHIKGMDVLIDALALLAAGGRMATATIVGEGPDAGALRALAGQRGLGSAVRFAGYLPARTAFALGHLLIVPSRAESLPYIVLEAAAAGVPMLATGVGGIPEVFDRGVRLLPAGDAAELARAIAAALDNPSATANAAERLRTRVRAHFSQDSMVDGVLAAYGDALAAKFYRSQ